MENENRIKALKEKDSYGFDDLTEIMHILRMPGGCSWDAGQTHESIRDSLIEETYEVVEAIDNKDRKLLCEELGDVLLQVVFHAEIEAELGGFDIGDVINGICRKLIHRHPHIFGDTKVNSTEDILSNWEKIKSEEKSRTTLTSKLRSVPKQYPALMRAEKVGKKAECFDFPDADSVFLKLDEEKEELRAAAAAGDPDKIHEEAGDLLLTATTLCRKLGVKPERALGDATDKFISRFELIENELLNEGKRPEDATVAEMDAIWDKNKAKSCKNQ